MNRHSNGPARATVQTPPEPEVFDREIPESELLTIDLGDAVLRTSRQLWKHPGFLARCLIVAFAISTLLAFVLPVRYESTALLMPPDETNKTGMAMLSVLGSKIGDGLDLAGDLLGGFKTSGALFIGILRSRTVEDEIIRRFDLRKVYWVKYWQDARKKLANRTQISEEKKTGIITITVIDSSPQRAAAMAQAYVDELNILVAQVSTSSARRERIFLEQRLQGVKEELHSAAVDFSQFASRNTAINIPEQAKAMVEAAARLQGELISAQSELTALEQIYSSSNVRVRTVRARVQELQRQLDKVGGKDVGSEEGTGSIPELYPSIRELPLLGVKYADLYRNVKVQEAVFETLTKQYEMAKVAEAKELPTVKVLDSPQVAEKRSSPPRLMIVILGSLFGFFLGASWLVMEARTGPSHPVRILLAELSDQMRELSARHFRKHRPMDSSR